MADQDAPGWTKGMASPNPLGRAITKASATKASGSDGIAAPGGFLYSSERNPRLIGRNKWKTFDEITVNTAIVAAAIGVWTNLAGSCSWSCIPNKRGGKDADKACDLVTEGLFEAQMSKPWRAVVRRQVVKKFRGFAMHEVLIRKRSDGMIVVGDLQHRPQWTVYRWIKPDEQTPWQAIEQLTDMGGRFEIDRARLLYSVEDTLTDSPDGVGILRQVAELARVRDAYQRLEGIGFQTNLNGMPIGRAPLAKLTSDAKAAGCKDADAIKAYIEAQVSFMRALLEGHNKTADQSILLDSAPYLDKSANQTPSSVLQWSFDVVRTTVAGIPEVAAAIARLDREMARVMCAEWLLLGSENSGGAYSMHEDKTEMFGLVIDACMADVADDARRDIATRLVALNGLDPETCTPTLVPEPLARASTEAACRALMLLAQAGLHPDDEAPNILRERMDLPHAPKIPAQDWLLPRGEVVAPPGTADVPGKLPVVGAPAPASSAAGGNARADAMPGDKGTPGNPNAAPGAEAKP